MPYSNMTFTVSTGLAFVINDFVQLSHDDNNYVIGRVVSYNSGTGALVITPLDFKGSGTYNSWTVSLTGYNGTAATAGTSSISESSGTSGTSATSATSGTAGESDSSGTSGLSGSTGTSGLSGNNGKSGSAGTSGKSGKDGTAGTSGTSGTSANSADSGTSGTTGTSGTSATSGSSASSGLSGTSGTSGSSGTSASSGTNGTAGANGANGATGPIGSPGATGATGPTGSAGTSGSSGVNGPTGPIGGQGPVGLQGFQGPIGAQGPAGGQGPRGAQGPSGGPGPQGVGGPTGPTGPAGGSPGPRAFNQNLNQFAYGVTFGPLALANPYVAGATSFGRYKHPGGGGTFSSANQSVPWRGRSDAWYTIGALGSTYFYNSSSRALKENIKPFKEAFTLSALDILNEVSVVSFNYEVEQNDEDTRIGFIAEDTPTILSGNKNDIMDTVSSIGLLLKAVQELDERTTIVENKKKNII